MADLIHPATGETFGADIIKAMEVVRRGGDQVSH